MCEERNGFLEIQNLDFDCLIEISDHQNLKRSSIYGKISSSGDFTERIAISLVGLRTEYPESKRVKQ